MVAKRYGNRWETLSPLGEGGQAHTFLVKDLERTDDEGRWVLKRLKNPSRLGRFKQEIETLGRLDSPRIPSIVDFSLDEPAYFVVPYLGPTLDTVIPAENLQLDECIDLFNDVVTAVSFAHANGITHRDIKPNNVVVDGARGSGRRAYLIDFGICQWAEAGLYLTTTDEPFGNRSFAAPECELGSLTEPDQSSDVYSLGKLLYWMVTGGQFFARENLRPETVDRIPQPRGVERAFLRRIIASTVMQNASERISADLLRARVERDAELMRLGINAVGAPNQLCPICRQGTLERRQDLGNLGYSAVGNPPAEVRLLHCDYCGFLQHHFIGRTISQHEKLWEI